MPVQSRSRRDRLSHRHVGQRPAARLSALVHEHVVRVELAVLRVHVSRVQPHQRGRHGHRDSGRGLGPGAANAPSPVTWMV